MPTDPQTTQTSTLGRDTNPDPITGEPGAHPVGTGVGAAAGGTTGAALGSLAGPIGTAVGAVIGAIAGGLAGKGVAESIDPSAEDAYWRENHAQQSFAKDRDYEDYMDAYRSGYRGYRDGKTFEEREADLRMEYEGGPQKSEAEIARAESTYPLHWDDAREAARAAYERVRRGEAAKRTAD